MVNDLLSDLSVISDHVDHNLDRIPPQSTPSILLVIDLLEFDTVIGVQRPTHIIIGE